MGAGGGETSANAPATTPEAPPAAAGGMPDLSAMLSNLNLGGGAGGMGGPGGLDM